jgi:hypothetical protein
MGNPTATLERENLSAMNLPASQLDEVERPRAAAIKFTYPSGSRPLEGYTIKRGVGRGGFGEVYFATSDAGKEVALKLIRRNLEVELRGVTQCLNLKHPNLIALYDIRTDEMGDQWVIMEYVSGESLEDVIERHPGGMPLAEALWWIRGICAGVAYLHDHGIVHRDLKPGNIFSDEGTVKIGDYGLAKFISCSRRSGQTESVGTVHYMAPEIANGRYGREIDTYALGIILFEMLTGRVPFEGESVGEVLMKHLTAEPDLSAVEEPYRDIVQRALAKDPSVRLKSVNEILSLLPDIAGSPPAGAWGRTDHRTAAGSVGTVQDLDSIAQDGWKKSAEVIRNADKRAAAATLGTESIEEPIWKAVRDVFGAIGLRWNGKDGSQFTPLQRALIIFALVVCCLWFWGIIVRLAVPVAICYGVYYIIWASAIRPGMRRDPARGAQPVAAKARAAKPAADTPADMQTVAWQPSTPVHAPAREAAKPRRSARRRRPNWRMAAYREITARPLRDKFSELLGSMIVAAIVAAVAAGIGPMMLAAQADSERAAMYLWLVVVGTLGSWAILVPTKFAEGKLEDQVPMRVTLLGLGALVGVVAWTLGDVLLLQPASFDEPMDAHNGLISQEWLRLPRVGEGINPSLLVYMTYFAFLFLLPRWWRQAEFTRDNRLSLWWLSVSMFWAWVIHLFWWFPQPTGIMAAGVIAAATQMSSPWMPPSRRRELNEIAEQTV